MNKSLNGEQYLFVFRIFFSRHDTFTNVLEAEPAKGISRLGHPLRKTGGISKKRKQLKN